MSMSLEPISHLLLIDVAYLQKRLRCLLLFYVIFPNVNLCQCYIVGARYRILFQQLLLLSLYTCKNGSSSGATALLNGASDTLVVEIY